MVPAAAAALLGLRFGDLLLLLQQLLRLLAL
jgi:hypothetical protein